MSQQLDLPRLQILQFAKKVLYLNNLKLLEVHLYDNFDTLLKLLLTRN